MKPRHVAALALVGWYLMVPPYDGERINSDAPISKWTVYIAHDTAQDCEETKVDQYKRVKAAQKGTDLTLIRRALVSSQCIASNDPRLAK